MFEALMLLLCAVAILVAVAVLVLSSMDDAPEADGE